MGSGLRGDRAGRAGVAKRRPLPTFVPTWLGPIRRWHWGVPIWYHRKRVEFQGDRGAPKRGPGPTRGIRATASRSVAAWIAGPDAMPCAGNSR